MFWYVNIFVYISAIFAIGDKNSLNLMTLNNKIKIYLMTSLRDFTRANNRVPHPPTPPAQIFTVYRRLIIICVIIIITMMMMIIIVTY